MTNIAQLAYNRDAKRFASVLNQALIENANNAENNVNLGGLVIPEYT